jgi:zinc protease
LNTLLTLLLLAAQGTGDVEARVTEFTLANGLHVIVYVDSSAPVASVNVYYRVGSYYEHTGQTGISHMLEHMSFKHTDVYRPGDFDRIVDSAGGNNNGFTSTYYTGYYEDFARDRWELGLKIEAARMAKCVFPDSEFESEHQVVSEERRLGDNRPMSELWEEFEATAYLVNPQRNPTIGWSDDVRRFSVGAVREWYAEYYNPANAVLVVTGDVRPEAVEAAARKYFGKLKGTPVVTADYYGAEPQQHGERRITVKRRVNVPSLIIGYHVPGIRDSFWYAGEVAGGIIGRGRSSRLYRKLVTELGLATSVWGGTSVEVDPGLFEIGITPKAESLMPRIEQVVQTELERIAAEPVSDRELEQVRNTVVADQMFQRDDISGMAYLLATNQITTGTWRTFLAYPEHVNRVTKEQIQDYAGKWFRPDNRTVGYLVPTKEAK